MCKTMDTTTWAGVPLTAAQRAASILNHPSLWHAWHYCTVTHVLLNPIIISLCPPKKKPTAPVAQRIDPSGNPLMLDDGPVPGSSAPVQPPEMSAEEAAAEKIRLEVLTSTYDVLLESRDEILSLTGCDPMQPESLEKVERLVMPTRFTDGPNKDDPKECFVDVGKHFGDGIATAVALLSLESEFGDKKSTDALLERAHPLVKVVWTIMNMKERIAPYEKQVTLAFGQRIVHDILEQLDALEAFALEMHRAAPQGSDMGLYYLLTALLIEALVGEDFVDEAGNTKIAPYDKVLDVLMSIEFKHTAQDPATWGVSKADLTTLAEEGKLLVLAERGSYYIFNAAKFLEFLKEDNFSTITKDLFPDFDDPAEVGEEGVDRWGFHFDSSLENAAKDAKETLVKHFLAGAYASKIFKRLAGDTLEWDGRQFNQLLIGQPALAAFLQSAIPVDLFSSLVDDDTGIDALRELSREALGILADSGVAGLQLHTAMELNTPRAEDYVASFRATFAAMKKLEAAGYDVLIPHDDTVVYSLLARVKGNTHGKWLRVKVTGCCFANHADAQGVRYDHNSGHGVERFPAGNKKGLFYPFPLDSYDIVMFVGFVMDGDEPRIVQVFVASQGFVESTLLRDHGGAGYWQVSYYSDGVHRKRDTRGAAARKFMSVDLDNKEQIAKLFALQAPLAVRADCAEGGERFKDLVRKRKVTFTRVEELREEIENYPRFLEELDARIAREQEEAAAKEIAKENARKRRKAAAVTTAAERERNKAAREAAAAERERNKVAREAERERKKAAAAAERERKKAAAAVERERKIATALEYQDEIYRMVASHLGIRVDEVDPHQHQGLIVAATSKISLRKKAQRWERAAVATATAAEQAAHRREERKAAEKRKREDERAKDRELINKVEELERWFGG